MAELHEIKRIYVESGICHIVSSEMTNWVFTLCGTMQTGKSTTRWPAKRRVCRECRKRLKTVKVPGAVI